MSELKVCDYSDYDYKTEFWSNGNRQYEHELELSIVNQLLRTYGNHMTLYSMPDAALADWHQRINCYIKIVIWLIMQKIY